MFPEDDTESEERQEVDKIDLQPLFERLAKSKFRSSFYLNAKDKAYIKAKGWDKIEQGTRETIAKRLAPAFIPQRRQTDADAPRHFPTVHRPACHRLLLSRMSGEMAWHTERPSVDRKGTDLHHPCHHGVVEKKRPVNEL